jgi:antitoxin (DNA-binding transcriptional repressor) of toxin-antitoxin stability system
MQVDIAVAKKRLSRLIKSAQQGEEVVIIHRCKPLAPPAAARNTRGWSRRRPRHPQLAQPPPAAGLRSAIERGNRGGYR